MTKLSAIIAAPRRYRLLRPAHLRLVAADLVACGAQPERDDRTHLEAALGWLCRAQDQRDGHRDAGSVSAGWSFEDGWLPGYPETSGYVVETLLAAADTLNRDELRQRAARILDWELSLQHDDGAFPGHFGEPGSEPVIFNTGQIVHGLMAGWAALGREDCLEAAVRAAEWMVERQDPDGCWRRSVHNGVPHTYNTRAAWALLRTGLAAGEQRLVDAAVRNLDWALGQQHPDGWFAQCAFTREAAPFTHTIAYAARGLLESGLLIDEPRYVAAARRAAAALADRQAADGGLAGAFGAGWQPRGRYCCLTGLAQTAIIWQRLAQQDEDARWASAADRAVAFLRRHHRITGTGAPWDGGVAGSAPLWGAYSRFEYPNWAPKFLADALLMRLGVAAVPAHAAPSTAPAEAVAS